MPEKMPPMPEWEPEVGSMVRLRDDVRPEVKKALAPHIVEDTIYTVVDVIPEDEEGPAVVVVVEGSIEITPENADEYADVALPIAITHVEQARLH